MPLKQSGDCQAFFANRAQLIKDGKTKDQATAIASGISKKNGGDPKKCLGGKKKEGEKKPAAKKEGEKKDAGKKAPPFKKKGE